MSLVSALFTKYSSLDASDPFAIGMEGIASLCDDVGVDPTEDVRSLVLLWRLGASSKPGQISQAEWAEGMKKNGVDSIDSIKTILPSLDTGFMLPQDFKSFYIFVFQFSRESGSVKTIEKDMVISLLQMVLAGRNNLHLESFCDFLTQCDTTRITLDQWTVFLEFSLTIGVDCKGYDENSGWTVLLDDYVLWKTAQAARK